MKFKGLGFVVHNVEGMGLSSTSFGSWGFSARVFLERSQNCSRSGEDVVAFSLEHHGFGSRDTHS